MTYDIRAQGILIIDFGSQYTQLIARRVRAIGVYCEIHPYDINNNTLQDLAPRGIILTGGPESVNTTLAPQVSQLVFDLGIPVLGICYGMQTMAIQMGGQVMASEQREFGFAEVTLVGIENFLSGIKDHIKTDGSQTLDVWMSHGDQVTELPLGFELIASTKNAPIAAMACKTKNFYGLQFHPEVTHTRQGSQILERFIIDICQCEQHWTTTNIITNAIANVRAQVGTDRVLLGLSGGVDSSVVATLLHHAIGDRLICVFVDHGLLRQGEADEVMDQFVTHMGVQVIQVNAAQLFLDKLIGITDAEAKRKVIGSTFIEVFDAKAQQLKDIKWLAQGTIYPDIIESAAASTGKAHVIKSHHNVGGLPDDMTLQLVEPLRELFKDEVRQLGLELGLPYTMVYRHPFPGPGLSVRILGEVKPKYVQILRQADAIFIEELHQADWYHKVNQAFVVFLPVKSVGVVGDGRRYQYVVSLRAIETIDFMTARWAHLPYELLEKVSNRIINEIEHISRVTYDVSSKPPSTIEWE